MFLSPTYGTQRRKARNLYVFLACLFLSMLTFGYLIPWAPAHSALMSPYSLWQSQEAWQHYAAEVTLVVASQKKDNTTWLEHAFTDWDKKIYVTDDPDAAFTIRGNRGREGMVYLSYQVFLSQSRIIH